MKGKFDENEVLEWITLKNGMVIKGARIELGVSKIYLDEQICKSAEENLKLHKIAKRFKLTIEKKQMMFEKSDYR